MAEVSPRYRRNASPKCDARSVQNRSVILSKIANWLTEDEPAESRPLVSAR